MFVSRVAVSLRIPGLKKKSIVKITSPVHNCRLVEVYMPAILFCCIEEVRSLLELRQLSILRRICACLRAHVCVMGVLTTAILILMLVPMSSWIKGLISLVTIKE